MSMTTTAAMPGQQSRSAGVTSSRSIIIATVVLLAHAPLIFAHFQQLWLKPHYQLFPMVLAGGFALVWPFKKFNLDLQGPVKWAIVLMGAGVLLVVVGMVGEAMEMLPGSPANWIAIGGLLQFAAIPLLISTGLGAVISSHANPSRGIVMLGICWALLAIGVFFGSATLVMFSALLLIAATAVTLGGKPLLLRTIPALGYLLLLIPPPFGLDTVLVQKLQVFASQLSSRILDLIGVFHNLNGVTIEIGRKKFEVENACSGISSLLSTLACVLFYVLWFRIHWIRATLLTLISVFWVLMNNTARIVCITFFDAQFGINLSQGIPHQMLGMLLFALTLGLIWSTDRLLMFFGRSSLPVRRYDPITANPAALESGFTAGLNRDGGWYRSIPLAVLFAAALVIQVAEMYAFSAQVPYSGSALSKLYGQIEVDLLPETVGRWTRPKKIRLETRDATNPLGQYSRIWQYSNPIGPMECLISLDYPYPEYHDLRVCYENTGWQLGEPKQFEHQPANGQTLHCVFVPLKRPVEQYASLWFCNFDQDGTGLVPSLDPTRVVTMRQRMADRFVYAAGRWQRLFFPSKTAATSGLGSVIQVQALCPSFMPLAENARADLEKLFVAAAERLQAKCVELKNKR